MYDDAGTTEKLDGPLMDNISYVRALQ